MGIARLQRDEATISEGLTRWLADRSPDAADLRITSFTRPTDGLSSETYMVDVAWTGGSNAIVVRLAPNDGGLFPTYDVGEQGRLQAARADLGIPTARPIAFEADVAWVGAPFLVMPRVAGRIPQDNPPYYRAGWLHDAEPELQRAVYTGFIDVLADIHRVDPRAAGAPAGDLAGQVRWWADYLEWASGGSPPEALAFASAWCVDQMPSPAPPSSLQWGDVRLGNVLFSDEGQPAAVLDWEMSAVGPAEVDLGWFFGLREMTVPGAAPELPGFLDRDATLARYSARLGREVGDLEWYEIFALVRSTAILVRMQRLLAEQGDTDHWLTGFDPVPRRLKKLAR